MRFAHIDLIYLFWWVGFLILFFVWADFRRKKRIKLFVQENLFGYLIPYFNFRRVFIKQFLIILAFIFLILALMRPQVWWGYKWRRISFPALDILIAVDVSRSMLAQDLKPNRLERARIALKGFVRNLKGERLGLIAFTSKAFLVCPFTHDYAGFLLSVESLDTKMISVGGTAIGQAIERARQSFSRGSKRNKILIIISDGENHQGDALESAKIAKGEGIKIFCIGVGTREGELIPVLDDKGNPTFLKDRAGNIVKTRLQEKILEQIALLTGGSYIRASTREFGLDWIYKEKLSLIKGQDSEQKMIKSYQECFQIPLFLAFLLLVAELFIREERCIKAS